MSPRVPESYKCYLVSGLREAFGRIDVPIRLPLRSGSVNSYAPIKREG